MDFMGQNSSDEADIYYSCHKNDFKSTVNSNSIHTILNALRFGPSVYIHIQKHDSVSVNTAGDLPSLCQETGDNNNDPNTILHIWPKTQNNKEL